jgi:hypothetical protein
MKTFLLGLGIGLGVSFLVAPASGDVTRSKLWNRISRNSEWFKEGADRSEMQLASRERRQGVEVEESSPGSSTAEGE